MRLILGYMFQAIQTGSWGGLVVIFILGGFNIFTTVKFTIPYARAQEAGPVVLTAEQIINVAPANNLFSSYSISGSSMRDTGYYHWYKENGVEVRRTYYGFLTVGDRVLLANVDDPIDGTKTTFTGTFFTMDEKQELLGNLAADYPSTSANLLPFYFMEYQVNANGDNSTLTTIVSFQIVLLLITMYAMWRFLVVTVFPEPQPKSKLTFPEPIITLEPKAKVKPPTKPVPTTKPTLTKPELAAKPAPTAKPTPKATTTQTAPRVMADPKAKLRALTKPKPTETPNE